MFIVRCESEVYKIELKAESKDLQCGAVCRLRVTDKHTEDPYSSGLGEFGVGTLCLNIYSSI